jgi:hypothetical protein
MEIRVPDCACLSRMLLLGFGSTWGRSSVIDETDRKALSVRDRPTSAVPRARLRRRRRPLRFVPRAGLIIHAPATIAEAKTPGMTASQLLAAANAPAPPQLNEDRASVCLKAAGATWADVAKTNTFATELDEFQKCADIRTRYLEVATRPAQPSASPVSRDPIS